MIGFRSGKLTVEASAEGATPKRAFWLCRCDCGGSRVVMGKYLRAFEVKSCGCLNRTSLVPRTTHGLTQAGMKKPRAYITWASMKERCLNPKSKKWPIYGGRGITVTPRWMKFENFYADMGDPPAGMSLDRIDVNKGYSKKNCRWATPQQQARNTRTNRYLQYGGRKQILQAWAEELAVSAGTLHARVAKHGEREAINHFIQRKNHGLPQQYQDGHTG